MRRSPLHGALGPPGAPAEGRIRWAWLAALALLFLAGGWGWQVYRARQDEAAAQAERYRAYIERREYRAQSVACRLEFPSGSATRVEAYGDFRWRSWPAELASSAVDSEGEQWAEFYATGSRAQAESLLQGFAADLAHPLLRQRLWSLYFNGHLLSAVDQLEGRVRVVREGSEDGWHARIAWIESPHAPIRVLPPAAAAGDPAASAILTLLRAGEASPHWQGPDAPGAAERRHAFDTLAERTLATWRDDPAEQARQRRRWLGERHHVYLVEAARILDGGHVLILRRFGSVLGPGSIRHAGQLVAAMADSVRCLPAEKAG